MWKALTRDICDTFLTPWSDCLNKMINLLKDLLISYQSKYCSSGT